MDLAAYFGMSASILLSGVTSLDWDDKILSLLPNAVRLCHLFGVVPGSTGPGRSIVWAREQQFSFDSLEQFEAPGDEPESTPPLIILQPAPGLADQ